MDRRSFFHSLAAGGLLLPTEAITFAQVSTEEVKKALSFYAGEQWPPEIGADRRATGRPCLTLNRLPLFVAKLTQHLETKLHRRLSVQEQEALIVSVVREAGDAQRLYNYAMSSLTEQRLPETALLVRQADADLERCYEKLRLAVNL